MTTKLLFIGHRGTRTNSDENTIEAFKKALEFGANYVEFDVRKTKDEKIVIIHDSTLDRTTNGSGLIKNLNYNEVLKPGTKNHKYKIPLLSETLKSLKGRIKFMIELKEDDLKDTILDMVKNFNLLDDCIFSGRNLTVLEYIKSAYPNTKICYNITKGLGLEITEFMRLGKLKKLKFKPDMISLRSNLVNVEFIETCHINNIKSLAWDFVSYDDPLFIIKSMINMGIDGLLFDDHRNIVKIKCWLSKT
ncbi:MAG: glycerophosphodiester phosphodiesterase [Candidatus Lokiarchaeota archaeon]|nr:glycerophosphodiester phosphodiesterase [Candidatus Lokiarchaeota archaeon]